MKDDIVVIISDRNNLEYTKQPFFSKYSNAGWSGKYMLLTSVTDKTDLNWFQFQLYACNTLGGKLIEAFRMSDFQSTTSCISGVSNPGILMYFFSGVERQLKRSNKRYFVNSKLPAVGVEPTRGCPHQILSLARLPVSSRRHKAGKIYILDWLLSILQSFDHNGQHPL